MAWKLKWSPLLPILLLLAGMAGISRAGNIAVYWGQHGEEGTLAEACNSKLYAYVMVAFLNTFGKGQTPAINLAGHCVAGNCSAIGKDITACQSMGVKVLLSLGGADGSYGLSSRDDAETVATYLWEHYLGGSPPSHQDRRPLGDAVLDGIDFDIERGNPNAPRDPAYFDELAMLLSQFSAPGKKVYLTAAPGATYPDAMLGPALQKVRFDNVWVQFYDDHDLKYQNGDVQCLWNKWTTNVQVSGSFYLGVPASRSTVGYISPTDLTSVVLPGVKAAGKYGGIMVWDRSNDKQNNYSKQVKDSV